MRFNELMTGSKQDVAVKIFGDNLDLLATNAAKAAKIITALEGVQDINVEKVTGLPQIQIEYNRERIAEFGLNISDINRILKTAFAGNTAGVIYDEEKRFDLVVRLNKDYRQDLEDVKNLYVPLPSGGQISLDQVAAVNIKEGPAQISRENTKRRITIGFNVRGRDVQSVVEDVQKALDKKLKLPAGYYATYGGQFENLVAAKKRLSIAVPVALLLIFVLLYFTFHSLKQSLLIFSAVPLSAIGGVMALWLRGMNFSTPAGIGFIALFGVAVLNGIVLIAEFNRLEKEEGIDDIYQRVLKGLKTRLRPVVMTAMVASLGFLPMALSTSAGAEVQKPLATVVIGGLLTSTLLTLIVLPVLYILFSRRRKGDKIGMVINPSIIILFLIVGCLFTTQKVKAQQTLSKTITLKQAIQQALDSNLTVKSASYRVEMQNTLKRSSWDIGKTSIEYEYGQSNSSHKDNSFTVSQSFAFPGLYANQHRLAKANAKSSEIGLSVTTNEIVLQVKSNWWQLAFYYSKLRLQQYQDSLYNGFAKAAERKAQTGETNMLEKVSAQAQSLEVKDQIRQTLADIAIVKKKLQTLINSKETLKIADTILVKLELRLTSDSLVDKANPLLAYYQQLSEIARMESKVEAAKLYPDFTVGYFNKSIIGTQEVDGTARYFSSSDRFTGIQAGITIPLWFYPQTSRIKASKINERISLTNRDAYKAALSGQFETLRQEYQKYKSSLDYYEQSALPQAAIIIDQSTKSYKAGALDYIEYIQNLTRALQIKSNYLKTLNDYDQVIIEINGLFPFPE